MGSRGPSAKLKPAPVFRHGVPEPGAHLGAVASAEYRRAAQEIEASGMDLRQVDFALLETYAIAFAEVREFAEVLRNEGRTVRLPNGITALHPLTSELAAARRTLLACCRLLGFAPSERRKVEKRRDSEAHNPFINFIK